MCRGGRNSNSTARRFQPDTWHFDKYAERNVQAFAADIALPSSAIVSCSLLADSPQLLLWQRWVTQ